MVALSDADASAFEAWSSLAELTVRLFYGLPEFMVMKALLTAPRRKTIDDTVRPELQLDDDIAERVRLDKGYTRKLLATLALDRLVRQEKPRARTREGEERVSAANQSALSADQVSVYWGIDFEIMADAVAYKLSQMRRRMTEKAKVDQQMYVCPRCGAKISAIEISEAIDSTTGLLSCPSRSFACTGVEMVEQDNTQSAALIKAHEAALQLHTAGLQRALDDVANLPALTYCWPKVDENGDNVKTEAGGSARGGGSASAAAAPRGGGGGGGAPFGSTSSAVPVYDSVYLAPVPWMQTSSQLAAASAASAAEEQATGERGAGASSGVDASASADFDREYLRRYEEMQKQGAAAATSSSAAAVAASSSHAVDAMELDAPGQGEAAAEEEEEEDEEEGEEYEVMVQGVPHKLSELTEEAIETMTEEEHAAYFELHRSLM